MELESAHLGAGIFAPRAILLALVGKSVVFPSTTGQVFVLELKETAKLQISILGLLFEYTDARLCFCIQQSLDPSLLSAIRKSYMWREYSRH